jgi:hypothetical protein
MRQLTRSKGITVGNATWNLATIVNKLSGFNIAHGRLAIIDGLVVLQVIHLINRIGVWYFMCPHCRFPIIDPHLPRCAV